MRFISPHKFIPQKLPATAIIAGGDEVGRGPWAGPVVTAIVVIPPFTRIPGVNDSKKLSEAQRERLFEIIIRKCDFGIGITSEKEIDKIGLIKATEQGFIQALSRLRKLPDHLILDGRDKFQLPIAFTSVIAGDAKIKSIASASIIAKVTRDRIMKEFSKDYPQFQFQKHKGYGTRLHQQLIQKHGICDLHRKSFAPIKNFQQ